MSCVSLITAGIDQALEACSSSAVLLAWKRLSQTYDSRFLSNSILVRRGRRDLCKGVVQFHVRFLCYAGLFGVANSVQSD